MASLLYILVASMVFTRVSSYEFQVGSENGWTTPNGNETETYDDWATRNRFHIGDTINFKYEEDSVLVVNSEDYETCTISNPISIFYDGDTVIQFDRPGLFYFISGNPEHCNSGQRLVIRVMHPIQGGSPMTAPSPSPESGGGGKSRGGGGFWDSDNWGPPGITSASSKVDVSSCSEAVIFIGAGFVILCSFLRD